MHSKRKKYVHERWRTAPQADRIGPVRSEPDALINDMKYKRSKNRRIGK